MMRPLDEDRTRVLGTPFAKRTARWGIIAWTTIGLLILSFILFRYVLYPIRIIFPPLVVAMIAVYLLNPIVTRLERRGMRRLWGALLVYLVFASVVGTAMYFLIPLVADQVGEFVRAAPRIFGDAVDAFREFLARFGLNFEGAEAPSSEGIVDVLGRVFSFTRGLLDLAIVLVLGPILGFYFLVDLPKIKRGFRGLIPARRRAEVEDVAGKIARAIGAFFRGQLLVALFVGIAGSIGLFIVGLPFWAIVGLVTGLFNLVPLIGPFIGAAVAIFIAFTTNDSGGLLGLEPGLPLAVGSAIALLIVQQIDNHIISPNMIGRTVRLHPVTVMLGLLIGGTLLGLWGMLLAIPVIAAIKILFLHAWDTRVTWPPQSGEHPEAVRRTTAGGVPEVVRTREPVEPRPPPGWWTAVRRIVGGRRHPEQVEEEPATTEPATGDGPSREAGTPARPTP
jgi:predicted PurR-regulated permease PerM